MRHRSSGLSAHTLVATLALVWMMTVGVVAAAGGPPAVATARSVASSSSSSSSSSPSSAAAPQAGNFVGDETCVTCHESEGKSLSATLHGKAQNVRTPAGRAGQSCETCHGPGQKHVDSGRKEDIRRFDAMSPRDVNGTCVSCHSKGAHAEWQGSMHDARNVSCATCHSVHSPKSEKFQLKAASITEDVRDVPLLRISRLAVEVPEIVDLDLNPVMALPPGHGCRIVDACVKVRRGAPTC